METFLWNKFLDAIGTKDERIVSTPIIHCGRCNEDAMQNHSWYHQEIN